MRISELTVENFRSIKKCNVHFNEITALVGENNAGKTALLRALNSVFNWNYEEKYFLDNTHRYAARTVTKIEIHFTDIPSREFYIGKICNGEVVVKLTYSYGNTTRKRSLYYSTLQGYQITDERFIQEIKKDVDYIYIPASRGNNDLIWKQSSIFQRVLKSYAQFYTQARDGISSKVEKVADQLKTSIFKKIEAELKQATMLDIKEEYSLDYAEAIDYSVFLNKVGLFITDSGNKFPVTEYGSGIKSLSVIALYRILAKLEHTNIIIGIEEPETNLHPQAQKKLIASIKENRNNTEIQAILATHSPVIVDELNHEDIILARRIDDDKRGFYTKFTQIDNAFWDRYQLDKYKHNKFFRFKNSEFFFSKYVIIVESTTDAQVINRLIENELGEKIYYVSILNLDGVKNLKYPYFLLKGLDMPFSMVVDRDVFSQYKNGKMDKSRNPKTQLPEYSDTLNPHNPVINNLWSDRFDRTKLEQSLTGSYSKFFELCKSKKILPMQFCLEMDLVNNTASRKKYCECFNIPFDEHSNEELLITRKDSIKASDKIMYVVNSLPASDLPYSYKKIRRAIIEDVMQII